MSKSINAKREQIHSQIRKNYKKALFSQIRKTILYNMDKQDEHPLQSLLKSINIEENIEALEHRISEGNGYQQIMKLIDRGGIILLMNMLETQRYVDRILTLFSIILSKQTPRIGNMLVNRGFIQLVVMYVEDQKHFKSCCNILGNLAIEDQNIGILMLENNIHQNIINQIMKIIMYTNQQTYKNIQFGLWAIINIASSFQANIDLDQQFEQLASFTTYLINNHNFVDSALELMVEISYKNAKYLKNGQVIKSIDKLLSETNQTSDYLRNLTCLLNIIGPISINYQPFYRIIVFRGDYINFNIKILYQISKVEELRTKQFQDQIWWEKIIQFTQNNTQRALLLKIATNLNIVMSWVWHLLGTFLAKNVQFKHQIQGLRFLHCAICNNNKSKIRNLMGMYGINNYLVVLIDSQNLTIRNKAQQILDVFYKEQ